MCAIKVANVFNNRQLNLGIIFFQNYIFTSNAKDCNNICQALSQGEKTEWVSTCPN